MISLVANPAVLVIVLAIAGSSCAYGVKIGRQWTEHRIEALKSAHAKTIAKIEEQSAAAVAEKNKAAEEAAQSAPVPHTPTEVAALCQRSASCRERGQK
jgi:hypothetical protein